MCQGLTNFLVFLGEGEVITGFLWEAEVPLAPLAVPWV